MGNRKQPFGYKMTLGEIVIQEAEARLVQGIFRRYIAGESLNELTEALRQQDIPYDEGRLWNKIWSPVFWRTYAIPEKRISQAHR